MVLSYMRRAAQRSVRASVGSRGLTSSSAVSTETRFSAVRPPAASVASLFSTQSQTRLAQTTPKYVANDVTGILAGVAVVGALIGVGKMWWDASSSPSDGVSGYKRYAKQEISRDDLAQFFTDLKASVQQLFKQLPEIDSAFREHLKTNNIELTEEGYKQSLLQQLFDVLQNIEQQVVASRGWDPESFALAMEKFEQDEVIAQLQLELQELMQSVFPPPEIPEHLTPETTLTIFRELIKGMEQAMKEMLSHARAEGITDATRAMEEFSQIYMDQVEQINFEQMKKHNVTTEVFNVALQKYHAENADFKKQVEKLYAEQAEVFKRMGLKVE
ncbi:hypothetical protein Poli38472_000567 [Pythium oligandrum]|uniref:Uncharacterized protein n=1 Tax=Pythium oligandrum TaxID=41045 RepID=A0A8K1FEG7_PYTOL|nr:hypothetical protein Poli38472_000567 [Pythium oligandrum]|eukprot:TMW60525.1 hypothetical protein Poli38472_000567 [Pythium oligandrum]